MFAGVDLEHHRGAVSGLSHNGVGVRAGPERLGDEPCSQRVPSQLLRLGGTVASLAAARRWIISAIASPDIALAPMAPVLCTVGNNARPGSGRFGEPGAAAAVQHRLLLLARPLPRRSPR